MSTRLVRLALLLTSLALVATSAAAGPCQPAPHDGLLCHDGTAASRVLPDTTSPSGRLAFAWRQPDGSFDGEPDTERVENLLVRLSDGATLAKLGGTAWHTGTLRANRLDEIALWSPDSRWVVEISNDRWNTFALRAVALDADAAVATGDLLKSIEAAARAELRKRTRAGSGLAFRVDGDTAPTLGNDGLLCLRVMLYVPKQEPTVELEITARLGRKGKDLTMRIVRAKRVALRGS